MKKRTSLLLIISIILIGIFVGCSSETTNNENITKETESKVIGNKETITYIEPPEVEIYNSDPFQKLSYTQQSIEDSTKVSFDTIGAFKVRLKFNTEVDKMSLMRSIKLSNSDDVQIYFINNKKLELWFHEPKDIDYDITINKGMKDMDDGLFKEDFHLRISPTFLSQAEFNDKTENFMFSPKFFAGDEELFSNINTYDDTFVSLHDEDQIPFKIVFDEDLDLESVKSSIEIPFDYTVDGNTISFTIDKLDVGNEFLIKINKNLRDVRQRRLKDDISFHITPTQDVYAHLKIKGIEEEFNFDEIQILDRNDIPRFTDEPKTLVIEFTGAVNKLSVEEAIKEDLKYYTEDYSITWDGNTKIMINISSFKESGGIVRLFLFKAKDRYGFPIRNNFDFFILGAKSLYSYDKDSGAIEVIKEFHDKPYYIFDNPYFTKYIVMGVGEGKNYLYNKQQNSITKIPNELGFPVDDDPRFYTVPVRWLDGDTVIYFDSRKDGIMKYSFDSERLEMLLNTKELDIYPSEIKISPDREKLIIEDYFKSTIYIFTLDGTKIFKKILENLKEENELYFPFGIEWLNNDTIVYEVEDNYDGGRIVEIDIVNSKSVVISENGINPQAIPDYNSFVYWDYKEEKNILMIPGKKIIIDSDPIKNVHFLSNNKIIFNRGDKLITFNLETKEEKVIGEGAIIGTSKDGSKILFSVNNRIPY